MASGGANALTQATNSGFGDNNAHGGAKAVFLEEHCAPFGCHMGGFSFCLWPGSQIRGVNSFVFFIFVLFNNMLQ
jgi:hypothetical protein